MTDLLETAEERRRLTVSAIQLLLARIKRSIGSRARHELNRPHPDKAVLTDMADLYLKLYEIDQEYREEHGLVLDRGVPQWVTGYAGNFQLRALDAADYFRKGE